MILLLFLIIGVVLVQITISSDPPLLIHHLKQRFAKSSDSIPASTSLDHGYVTCASKKHIHDLLRTIYFLRTEWKSQYPISIMHCHELDQNDLDLITAMDEFGNITPIDICAGQSPLLSIVGEKRLRGFFCKVGALLESPYNVTVLIDVDVVWLRPPDLLFESQLLAETGALFFRDRVLHTPVVSKQGSANGPHSTDFLNLLQSMGISLNASYVQAQFHANGVSSWWRCLADYWPEETRATMCYGEAQDSSMVVVDKRRHPGMMAMLRRLLPSFDVGYGDKEIYWIAATLANEPFTFSPFAAAQYGDCSGQILHYLPDDVLLFRHQQNVTAAQLRRLRPFYINAEYMVEYHGKLNAVGNFFQSRYVAAQLFHDPRTMRNVTTDLFPHNHCYTKPHFASNCTCAAYECLPMPPWVLHQLAYHQWVSLSLRLDRSMSLAQYYAAHAQTPHCVPVLVLAMGALNGVFHHHASTLLYQRYVHGYVNTANALHRRRTRTVRNSSYNATMRRTFSSSTAVPDQLRDIKDDGFDPRNCGITGCPALPLGVFDARWQRSDNWQPGTGRYCEPVRLQVPEATQLGEWNVYPLPGVTAIAVKPGGLRANANSSANTSTMFIVIPRAISFGRNGYAEESLSGYGGASLTSLAKLRRQPIPAINEVAAPTVIPRGTCQAFQGQRVGETRS